MTTTLHAELEWGRNKKRERFLELELYLQGDSPLVKWMNDRQETWNLTRQKTGVLHALMRVTPEFAHAFSRPYLELDSLYSRLMDDTAFHKAFGKLATEEEKRLLKGNRLGHKSVCLLTDTLIHSLSPHDVHAATIVALFRSGCKPVVKDGRRHDSHRLTKYYESMGFRELGGEPGNQRMFTNVATILARQEDGWVEQMRRTLLVRRRLLVVRKINP